MERFFRSVEQLLLRDLPGYAPKGARAVEATLTLPEFEQRFRSWLLEDYHQRVQSEIKCKPAERWEAGGFVPRMPESAEQLDLLLLTVAKTRRVHQDGIRFQGHRIWMRPWLPASKKRSSFATILLILQRSGYSIRTASCAGRFVRN